MIKNKNAYAWLLLILLSLIWGSSPILIKKSLVSLGPFEIGALRLSFAAIVLIPFLSKNFKEVKKEDIPILLRPTKKNVWEVTVFSGDKNRSLPRLGMACF